MIDSAAENPPPLSEPLEDRLPRALYRLLEDLWQRHFHTQKAFPVKSPYFYEPYENQWSQIGLTLEYMYKIGLIRSANDLFDGSGKLRKDIPREAIDRLVNEKLLQGSKVAVVGGAEGRIFAEMGAEVVNFDESLKLIPSLSLPNLTEISEDFNGKYAVDYWEKFDVTYSHNLFDTGSSLSPFRDNEQYKSYLTMALWSTRENGISIHNGSAMPNIFNNPLCRVSEIAPVYKDVKAGQGIIYVLKKLKDTTPYT